MRKIIELPVDCIKFDKLPTNLSTLRLIDHMRNGGEVPPIHAYKTDSGWMLADGRHRLLAHKMLEIKKIKCKVKI